VEGLQESRHGPVPEQETWGRLQLDSSSQFFSLVRDLLDEIAGRPIQEPDTSPISKTLIFRGFSSDTRLR